jgi:hypothetical protein
LSLSGSVATLETARVLNENTSMEYFELQFQYQSAMEYIQAISCLTKNTTLKQLQFSSTYSPPHLIETEQVYQQLLSAARGNYGLTCHPSISIVAFQKTRRRQQQQQQQEQLTANIPTSTIILEEEEEEDNSTHINTSSSRTAATMMTPQEDVDVVWGDDDLRIIETLNRAGRQYLGLDAASKENAILVFHNVRDDLNAIFFHLMENPGVCHMSTTTTTTTAII